MAWRQQPQASPRRKRSRDDSGGKVGLVAKREYQP